MSEVVTLNTAKAVAAAPILRFVPTDEVKQHWPRVRAGLERIIADGLQPDWIPEDVYTSLRGLPPTAPTAYLYLVGEEGFIICQRYAGEDARGMLFVLACEGTGMLKHYPAVYDELEELARKANCKRIRHISSHPQWEGKFWRLLGYVYEHEVTQ